LPPVHADLSMGRSSSLRPESPDPIFGCSQQFVMSRAFFSTPKTFLSFGFRALFFFQSGHGPATSPVPSPLSTEARTLWKLFFRIPAARLPPSCNTASFCPLFFLNLPFFFLKSSFLRYQTPPTLSERQRPFPRDRKSPRRIPPRSVTPFKRAIPPQVSIAFTPQFCTRRPFPLLGFRLFERHDVFYASIFSDHGRDL